MEPTDDEERLDAEKLDVLREWGEGLAQEEREDVRAAGRAILLLIEEIDHLYVELWHARDAAVEEIPPVESLDRSLLARLRASLGGTHRNDDLDRP